MPSETRVGHKALFTLVAVTLVVGLLAGGIIGYSTTQQEISALQSQVSELQNQVFNTRPENITFAPGDQASLSKLYEDVKDSVVVVLGVVAQRTFFGTQYGQVEGSGFVYDLNGRMIIVTNFHVINSATDITVTFSDGNAYTATVLGSDPYADLAVLSTSAPNDEFKPLQIVSSFTLNVGDPVVAVGNPFGLTGSMTAGIISQLGRTLSESTIGSYQIANIIQTSVQINPGNSGGPLLNYFGQVVGITTAIISNSQGLGFAIPSDMILKEIGPLAETGKYTQHSWMGIGGMDMNYDIAKAMGVSVTRGWLVTSVAQGGPAEKAGLRAGTQQAHTPTGTVMVGGDIIVGINGKTTITGDDLLTYLEQNTSPGQTVDFTVIRGNETITVPVVLGTRPPLS